MGEIRICRQPMIPLLDEGHGDVPALELHGMLDDAVPWQTSLRLAERLRSQDVAVTLVKQGDHRLSTAADLARLGATFDELLGR